MLKLYSNSLKFLQIPSVVLKMTKYFGQSPNFSLVSNRSQKFNLNQFDHLSLIQLHRQVFTQFSAPLCLCGSQRSSFTFSLPAQQAQLASSHQQWVNTWLSVVHILRKRCHIIIIILKGRCTTSNTKPQRVIFFPYSDLHFET